jgi:hypothetical protein
MYIFACVGEAEKEAFATVCAMLCNSMFSQSASVFSPLSTPKFPMSTHPHYALRRQSC